ncbi:MAG: hypothetical protein AAGI38_12435 [Bacteroidota bacterium]
MREYTRYLLLRNDEIVYINTTHNIAQRLQQDKEVMEFTSYKVLGRKTTLMKARRWFQSSIAQFQLTHEGRKPLYNQ